MSAITAQVRVPERGVDARVEITSGDTLVLLGPNGSGKSTVLEAIAGILPQHDGAITLDGAAAPRETRHRRIGLLSQDDALFPTMSVRDNVAFGPRSTGASRREARAIADRWLARVELADLASRDVAALSGGQARRAAIARTLAAAPRAVLLDEPFAGLDVRAASTIRALLAHLLADVTTIVATHDALDAYAFGDHVAVLESGSVVEHGPTTEVLTRPRTPFAARMAARVLLTGTMRSGAIVTADGVAIPVAGGPGGGRTAAIALRPTEVRLDATGEARDPSRTWLTDRLVAIEPRGDEVRIHGRVLAADVDAAVAAGLTEGATLSFGVPRGLPAYAL